jgi:segregation and condensation protein B
MNNELLKRIIEGAIFAAGEPVAIDRLMGMFSEQDAIDVATVREVLQEIAQDCENRGYELKQVASGYRFQVKPDVSPWLIKLWEEKPVKYSRAVLETLALIAYRQPVTRGEIEEIRGVSGSSNIIKPLLDREWIRVVGHRDVPGKPSLYATTKTFLDYFNLKSLDELPTLTALLDLDEVADQLAQQLQLDINELTADGESHTEQSDTADESMATEDDAEQVANAQVMQDDEKHFEEVAENEMVAEEITENAESLDVAITEIDAEDDTDIELLDEFTDIETEDDVFDFDILDIDNEEELEELAIAEAESDEHTR